MRYHLAGHSHVQTSSPLKIAPVRAGDSERGAAAVEFGLVLVPLLMLVAALIDFGLVFNAYISASHGAHEGARFAAVTRTTSETEVDDRVIATAAPVEVLADEVSPVTYCGAVGTRASVEVRHVVPTPLLGLAGIDTITVFARGEERC